MRRKTKRVTRPVDLEANVFFAVGTTPADRLEAVPGVTTSVAVPVRRRDSGREETFALRASFEDGSSQESPVRFAAGTPRFETDEMTLSLVRYCACSQEVAVLDVAEGATAKVTKLSGSVPSGVTVKLVSGTPTRFPTSREVA